MRHLLFLSLALLKKRKKQTVIATLGVAIGFTAFVVMSSMMFGFQKYFIQQVIDIEPHITIKPKEETYEGRIAKRVDPESIFIVYGSKPKEKDRILEWREIIRFLEKNPEVSGVSYQLQAKGVLKYGSKEKPVSLIGIDPLREPMASPIERFLVYKRLQSLTQNRDSIIVGSIIARDVGIKDLGKKVTLSLPNGATKVMKIEDFFSSGITNIDSSRVYLSIKTLQALLNRENEVNVIVVKVRDVNSAEEIAKGLSQVLRYEVESWQRAYVNFLKIFKIQNMITKIIVVAIVLVSAFGMFNIIMMTVVDKRREIAIILAIGYQPKEVIIIFLLSGLTIWLLGSVIGIFAAYLLEMFLANVNIEMEGLIKSKGFVLDRSIGHYFNGLVLTLIFSLGASFYPSYKASRLNPVNIFRSY